MTSGPSMEMRRLVVDRAGGMCERCGAPGVDIHHRQPRKAGGTRRPHINRPSNLVCLCRACHDLVEGNRTYGYASGWLVREPADPASVPVLVILEGWVRLGDDGGYSKEVAA